MTDAERELRAASWREIAEREVDGLHDSAILLEDLGEAHSEALALLPLTELGELLIAMYDVEPHHWRHHLPLLVVAKIDYIKEAR